MDHTRVEEGLDGYLTLLSASYNAMSSGALPKLKKSATKTPAHSRTIWTLLILQISARLLTITFRPFYPP